MTICEVGTRDGLQIEPRPVSTEEKVEFVNRLAACGIPIRQIGPYRVRGVELTRFLSQASSTPWLAIHVMRTAGKTSIFFVPRPKA